MSAEEKLLTIREVSQILGITEKEVIDMAENGSIAAYKIGGVYLRFKRQQVEEARIRLKLSASKTNSLSSYPVEERLSDFFYYNDFYIFSVALIVLILWVIFRGF